MAQEGKRRPWKWLFWLIVFPILLLVFYTALIMGVVWLCNRLRLVLERRGIGA